MEVKHEREESMDQEKELIKQLILLRKPPITMANMENPEIASHYNSQAVREWNTEEGRQTVLKEVIDELKELRKATFASKWEFVDEKGKEEYAMEAASSFADKLINSLMHPQSYETFNYNIPYREPFGFSHQSYLWADKRPAGMDRAFKEAKAIRKSIRKVKGAYYVDLSIKFVDKEDKTIYFMAFRFDPGGRTAVDCAGDSRVEEQWNNGRYEDQTKKQRGKRNSSKE